MGVGVTGLKYQDLKEAMVILLQSFDMLLELRRRVESVHM
jgi:hypothetical protein